MPEKIITIYCFFDELLHALIVQDDPQSQLTTAEIMTIATVAAEFFTGNQQAALAFLTSHGYVKPFSKSRFNRRLHQIPETVWQFALYVLAQGHQQTLQMQLVQVQPQQTSTPNPSATQNEFIVDTFPLPVCRNIRIKRCKIYRDTQTYRGYCASKKEYFYGLKVCLVVTTAGQPVEMLLVAGSRPDVAALRSLELDLPAGSILFGDGGFLDLDFEAALSEDAAITLIVPRRKKMKEQLDGVTAFVCKTLRKQVETTFSQLTERMARSIHAITPRGFELKACLTVLAFSLIG